MSTRDERLDGCTAATLDSYLRGLGFFLIGARLDPHIRAWWDEDEVMHLVTSKGVDALCEALATEILEPSSTLVTPIKTPWRGKEGQSASFIDLRNDAADAEIPWFDACAVPRPRAAHDHEVEADMDDGKPAADDPEGLPAEDDAIGADKNDEGVADDPDDLPAGRERKKRSDRDDNPLIGRGGGFGRVEVADAHADAFRRMCGASVETLSGALISGVMARPFTGGAEQQLHVKRKVLGAYQSGRGTGPGASVVDLDPSKQEAKTAVWDMILVLEGLCAFSGSAVGRQEGAAHSPGFPLLVRARRAGTKASSLEGDPSLAYEFLAPLWVAPARADVILLLIHGSRMRSPVGIARDAVEAALVQAARSSASLGFTRLVRFNFLLPQKKKPQLYAVRRGVLHAVGSSSAARALEEIIPFARAIRRGEENHPVALRQARRRLDQALVSLATGGTDDPGLPVRRAARDLLSAVTAAEVAVARRATGSTPGAALHGGRRPARRREGRPEPPRLSGAWWALSRESSPGVRLAEALATAWHIGRRGWLREHLRPERRDDEGRWLLDPDVEVPMFDRLHDPLGALAGRALDALRTLDPGAAPRAPLIRPSDLAWLLALPDPAGALAIAVDTASFSALPVPSSPEGAPQAPDPRAAGLGLDLLRLLLAAAPAPGEDDAAARGRRHALASQVLAGHIGEARMAATREIGRRGIGALPGPPYGSPAPGPRASLSLALILPFDPAFLAGVVHANAD